MGSLPHQPSETQPWIQTPLVESSVLSRVAGCRIFLKLENLQPGSSFKSRGIGYLVQHHYLAAQKSPDFNPEDLHFFSSSGGNAGLACATACHILGVKCTVCVPLSTTESTIIKIKAAGATEVVSQGAMWTKADEYLRETLIPAAEKDGEKCIYVAPFDNPIIWEGASTMIDEIKAQMPDESPPDAIVCSVGGGGLFAGLMQGIDRAGWGDRTQVFAMETHGAHSLNSSLKAGHLITLPAITSIAKTLGASRVAERAFQEAQKPNVQSLVLTDAEAVEGVWRFADDERMLVEPACGVSVALAYRGRLKKLLKGFNPEMKVVIVVCGGSAVSLADLARWKDTYSAELPEEGEELMKVPSSVEV